MIVGSLLLIAGAATLLALGVLQASTGLLSASIAASLLAAVGLVVGVRRAGAVGAGPSPAPDRAALADPPPLADPPDPSDLADLSDRDDPLAGDDRDLDADLGADFGADVGAPGGGPAADGGAPTVAIPIQPVGRSAGDGDPDRYRDDSYDSPTYPTGELGDRSDREDGDDVDDEDPPDEPAPQQVSAAESARVGRMTTEVLVVDGRPRYHLPGCVHLLSRESEPLPVGEALDLGFTPCGLCEPDSALLADARRV